MLFVLVTWGRRNTIRLIFRFSATRHGKAIVAPLGKAALGVVLGPLAEGEVKAAVITQTDDWQRDGGAIERTLRDGTRSEGTKGFLLLRSFPH